MGCEVRSCKGTFHLPCAMMQASADGDEGCEDACSWCAPQCKPGGVCAVIVYCCVLFLLAGCSLWASSTSRFNPALPTAPACPLCWSNHQTTCERSLRRTAPSLTASAGSCFAPTTPPSAWGWRLKTSSSGGACCGGCYATASPCCPLQMPAARQPPSRRPADDQPPARPAQHQQQQQQLQVRMRGLARAERHRRRVPSRLLAWAAAVGRRQRCGMPRSHHSAPSGCGLARQLEARLGR